MPCCTLQRVLELRHRPEGVFRQRARAGHLAADARCTVQDRRGNDHRCGDSQDSLPYYDCSLFSAGRASRSRCISTPPTVVSKTTLSSKLVFVVSTASRDASRSWVKSPPPVRLSERSRRAPASRAECIREEEHSCSRQSFVGIRVLPTRGTDAKSGIGEGESFLACLLLVASVWNAP